MKNIVTSLRAAQSDRRRQVYSHQRPSLCSPCWRLLLLRSSPTCPWPASHRWSPAGQSYRGRKSNCKDRQLSVLQGRRPLRDSALDPRPNLVCKKKIGLAHNKKFTDLPFTSSNFLSVMLKPLASTTDNLENSRRSFLGFVSGMTTLSSSSSAL